MHFPMQSIYIRLRHANITTLPAAHSIRSGSVSNDLYGSEILGAFEAAKGYTHPVNSDMAPVPVDKELSEAHINIIVGRKLILILRSHSLKENTFRIGDLVQVFVKRGHGKGGRCLSPRQVISIETESGMLSVPGLTGHKIIVAFEDSRVAHVNSDITEIIQS